MLHSSHLDSDLVVTGILGLRATLTSTLALGAGALASLGSAIALGERLVGRREGVDVHCTVSDLNILRGRKTGR